MINRQNFSFMDFHDLRGNNRVADSYGVTNSVEVYDDFNQDNYHTPQH